MCEEMRAVCETVSRYDQQWTIRNHANLTYIMDRRRTQATVGECCGGAGLKSLKIGPDGGLLSCCFHKTREFIVQFSIRSFSVLLNHNNVQFHIRRLELLNHIWQYLIGEVIWLHCQGIKNPLRPHFLWKAEIRFENMKWILPTYQLLHATVLWSLKCVYIVKFHNATPGVDKTKNNSGASIFFANTG
jgi:hypothetical protein